MATAAKKGAPKRYYVTGDGKRYPLFEAPYDYPITVFKSDCRKAIIGDPAQCLIALGARRDKLVDAAFIGSGKDAYVIFKATKIRKAYALHFTMNAEASRVRDYFDGHKGATSQMITLSAVTPGRTMDHRSKLGKKRREEIKAGAEVKKRGKQAETRIMRVGMKHRPHAVIESNVVKTGAQGRRSSGVKNSKHYLLTSAEDHRRRLYARLSRDQKPKANRSGDGRDDEAGGRTQVSSAADEC